MDTGPTAAHRQKKLTTLILIALLALVVALELKRRAVADQLQRLTVRLEQLQVGEKQQNQERAQRVIRQVRTHIMISEDIEPTVATIVDVETLRERNAFYNKAENGDHLVVTPDRAILFSSSKNIILDVVPVQIEQLQGAAEDTVE